MIKNIILTACAAVAATVVLPIAYGVAFTDDELEKTLMTPPADVNVPAPASSSRTGAGATAPRQSSPSTTASSIRSFAPVDPLDLTSESVENEKGDIIVRNAKVEIPKGEGYEVTVSANGQGLLSELGLCAVDANGEVILNEDGSSRRQVLRRGMVVHKGDVLGKQQDDELVQEQIVAQQELLVAEKEAEKTLEIEVAEAAASVAQASYKRADALNRDMPGAVSQEELQEKYYDWVRAQKSIEKAKYDLEVNQEKVKVAKARVNSTKVLIRNRKFFSPIDGIIDDVYQNEGQWLREGDQVLRILRLDKVQITGAVDAKLFAPEAIDQKEIEVTVQRPGMQSQVLRGKIVYVRQVVESGHYYFYADVVNQVTDKGYWLLNPGSLVTITIRGGQDAGQN